MSDRVYAILITAAKYIFLNILATVAMVMIARAGWFATEDVIVLYYLIINCTALILGKLQQILDRLNEYEKSKKNYEKSRVKCKKGYKKIK